MPSSRTFMLAEVERDIDHGTLYLSPRLTDRGRIEWPKLLREAVEIDRRTEGADSPNYATSLHNLAGALIDLGDLAGAEEKLRETLALRRRILGNDHPMLLYTLNNLGFVLLEKGNWAAAEPVLKENLDLSLRLKGEARSVPAMNNWARLLQASAMNYVNSRMNDDQDLVMAGEEEIKKIKKLLLGLEN